MGSVNVSDQLCMKYRPDHWMHNRKRWRSIFCWAFGGAETNAYLIYMETVCWAKRKKMYQVPNYMNHTSIPQIYVYSSHDIQEEEITAVKKNICSYWSIWKEKMKWYAISLIWFQDIASKEGGNFRCSSHSNFKKYFGHQVSTQIGRIISSICEIQTLGYMSIVHIQLKIYGGYND